MGQPRRSLPQNVSRLVARLASTVQAAIFDLDGTLLPGTSAEREFIRFALKTGKQTAPEAIRAFLSWAVRIPIRGVQSNKTYFGGGEMDLLVETAETFCQQQLTHHIPDQAQRLICRPSRRRGLSRHCVGSTADPNRTSEGYSRSGFRRWHHASLQSGTLDGRLGRPARIWLVRKVRQSDEAARTYGFDLRESAAYGNAFDDRFLLAEVARSRRCQSRHPVSASSPQEGLADLYFLLKDNLEPQFRRNIMANAKTRYVNPSRVMLGECTRKEIRQALQNGNLKAAIIPIGATEQHNEHLSLDLDIVLSTFISQQAALQLYPQVTVAPPCPVGYSPYHMARQGTLTLRKETLRAYIFDVAESLKTHGIRTILVVNGHGGNHGLLRDVLPSVATRPRYHTR